MKRMATQIILRDLGLSEYAPTWERMQAFTDERSDSTNDEIWLLEHPPIFTVGLNGGMEHILAPGDIPVLRIDRGGQVTFHGPGQLIIYPLIDLRRRGMGVRALVSGLEKAVIGTLAEFGIAGGVRRDAPGVYVREQKIASLGLRIRRGCSYHGLAFNIAMDLEPFSRINPCGFSGLQVTSLAKLGGPADLSVVAEILKPKLFENLAN